MRHRVTKLTFIVALVALVVVASVAAAPFAQRRTRTARAPYDFSHATKEHQRACDSCHKFPSRNWQEVRKKEDAFADITEYPEHASCLDCHRQQFFARERPVPRICAVCHASATPRDQTRHPFPTLADKYDASPKGRAAVSDFAVNFPHAKHEGLFSQHRNDDRRGALFVRASFPRLLMKPQDDPAKANAACATCHQTQQPQGDSGDEFVTKPPKELAEGVYWLKKGTFKTTPRDHATCFTCHSADSGLAPLPNDCNACHKLTPPAAKTRLTSAHDDFDPQAAAAMGVSDRRTLIKWARRDAGRFRHEWPPHDLACTACHAVATLDTTNEATKKVRVMSCGGEGTGCHIEPTPGGVLNTEVAQKRASAAFECSKCHLLNGRRPLPETHAAAVAPTKK